jgi:hypothetical protein
MTIGRTFSEWGATAVSERTPVNLSQRVQDASGENEPKTVKINESLRHAPVPDMGEEGAEGPDNQ